MPGCNPRIEWSGKAPATAYQPRSNTVRARARSISTACSHRKGKVASLLDAVDPRHTQLVWVQTGFDDPKRRLRAAFALDAATVQQIRDTVGACLAPATKSKSAAKRS